MVSGSLIVQTYRAYPLPPMGQAYGRGLLVGAMVWRGILCVDEVSEVVSEFGQFREIEVCELFVESLCFSVVG